MSKRLQQVVKFIILGPPGSGKGTISSRIRKDFPVMYLSSGDMLRTDVAENTTFGLAAKQYINEGSLVPDKLVLQMMISEMDKFKGHSCLLDGFPRTLGQAEELELYHKTTTAINLDIPFDVIIERIQGRWIHAASGRVYHTEFNPPKETGYDDLTNERLIQRDDDKPEIVRARLEHYQKLTQPLLEFYKNLGVLENFKGRYSNEIWPRVHKFLSTLLEPRQYTEYK